MKIVNCSRPTCDYRYATTNFYIKNGQKFRVAEMYDVLFFHFQQILTKEFYYYFN